MHRELLDRMVPLLSHLRPLSPGRWLDIQFDDLPAALLFSLAMILVLRTLGP